MRPTNVAALDAGSRLANFLPTTSESLNTVAVCVRLVQRQVGHLLANHPRVLTEAMAASGDEAKRAFDAMMGMKKIDIAAIKAARGG